MVLNTVSEKKKKKTTGEHRTTPRYSVRRWSVLNGKETFVDCTITQFWKKVNLKKSFYHHIDQLVCYLVDDPGTNPVIGNADS